MSIECSICLSDIVKSTGCVELSCSHKFHLKCISKWLCTKDNCPMCRKSPSENEKLSDILRNPQISYFSPPLYPIHNSSRNITLFAPTDVTILQQLELMVRNELNTAFYNSIYRAPFY